MRIEKVTIENYRCLHRLELEFDALTVLIGANSTGKSSVLRAIGWFFEGGGLEPEDVCGQAPGARVSVGVTFGGLTQADRDALGTYATGKTATFWRTWSAEDGVKLTGRAMAYRPFEQVREHQKANDLRKAYTQLRKDNPSMGLPAVTSRDAALNAMRTWEAQNTSELEPATSSATHLFGFSGQPRLAGRFDYVFVPAISDAEEQTRHARGTLMEQVFSRSVAGTEQVTERLREIHEETAQRIDAVLHEEHGDTLEELSDRFTGALRRYVPTGQVRFQPQPPDFRIPSMHVSVRVADSGLETDVGRQGHGFQRALLMAAVQELARVTPQGAYPARDPRRCLLRPAQRLCLASVAPRLPTLEDCLPLLQDLAPGGHLGEAKHCPPRATSGAYR